MTANVRRCHVIVPSVWHAEVGRGGLNHYRGAASALAAVLPTTVHQPALPLPRRTEWNRADVPVAAWADASGLLAHLRRVVAAGDLVVKYAGAFGVQGDVALDRALLSVRDVTGCVLVYADPDAPHRLPLLDARADLPFTAFDRVWCFQGGERAVVEYGRLLGGRDVVRVAPFAVSALPVLHREPPSARVRRFDLVATVGAASGREDRLTGLVERAVAQAPPGAAPLRLGLRGELVPEQARRLRAAGAVVVVEPPCDPDDLLATYADADRTLNLVRRECADYPDVPACRVFEAAAMGSVPVTDHFAGLERYFRPGEHALLLDEGVAWWRDRVRVARMGERARRRLDTVVEEGVSALRELVRDAVPAPVASRPARRDRPARVAVLGDWDARSRAALAPLIGEAHVTEDVSTVDAIAVTAELKNAMDDRLRAEGVRVPLVYVDVADPRRARAVRWVPGRDVAVPDDAGWPWSTPDEEGTRG